MSEMVTPRHEVSIVSNNVEYSENLRGFSGPLAETPSADTIAGIHVDTPICVIGKMETLSRESEPSPRTAICAGVASAACLSCAARNDCPILRMMNTVKEEDRQPDLERQSYLNELLSEDTNLIVAGYAEKQAPNLPLSSDDNPKESVTTITDMYHDSQKNDVSDHAPLSLLAYNNFVEKPDSDHVEAVSSVKIQPEIYVQQKIEEPRDVQPVPIQKGLSQKQVSDDNERELGRIIPEKPMVKYDEMLSPIALKSSHNIATKSVVPDRIVSEEVSKPTITHQKVASPVNIVQNNWSDNPSQTEVVPREEQYDQVKDVTDILQKNNTIIRVQPEKTNELKNDTDNTPQGEGRDYQIPHSERLEHEIAPGLPPIVSLIDTGEGLTEMDAHHETTVNEIPYNSRTQANIDGLGTVENRTDYTIYHDKFTVVDNRKIGRPESAQQKEVSSENTQDIVSSMTDDVHAVSNIYDASETIDIGNDILRNSAVADYIIPHGVAGGSIYQEDTLPEELTETHDSVTRIFVTDDEFFTFESSYEHTFEQKNNPNTVPLIEWSENEKYIKEEASIGQVSSESSKNSAASCTYTAEDVGRDVVISRVQSFCTPDSDRSDAMLITDEFEMCRDNTTEGRNAQSQQNLTNEVGEDTAEHSTDVDIEAEAVIDSRAEAEVLDDEKILPHEGDDIDMKLDDEDVVSYDDILAAYSLGAGRMGSGVISSNTCCTPMSLLMKVVGTIAVNVAYGR